MINLNFAVHTNWPLHVLYSINAPKCALDLNYSQKSVGEIMDKSYMYNVIFLNV